MASKPSPNFPSFMTGYYGPSSSSSRGFQSLVRAIGEAKSKHVSLYYSVLLTDVLKSCFMVQVQCFPLLGFALYKHYGHSDIEVSHSAVKEDMARAKPESWLKL